jgi:hypothetical protein
MMKTENLKYGECPLCGDMCQPPDGREKDNTEFCYCCDCGIIWFIVHTPELDACETHHNVYDVIGVENFIDTFTPHDCK